MLKSIEIKGYRGFEQYRVEGLSRVNLLVGKNNCGKTALLEAIWLGVSRGDTKVLLDIAERRGELILVDEQDQHRSPVIPVGTFIEHFFHGHTIEIGSSFTITSQMHSDQVVSVSFEIEDEGNDGNFDNAAARFTAMSLFGDFIGGIGLVIHNSADPFSTIVIPIMLNKESRYKLSVPTRPSKTKMPPVQYIFPEITRAGSLSATWNAILRDGQEKDVVELMQILDPNIKAIHFLSRMNRYLNLASDSIIVVFKSGERVPLGTLGDGMRYLLGLAIFLIQTDGGVILIDEIDTGLHYSVMGDLWRLVVETAKQREIQVFATTHSQDCVRGLAWLCENYPDLKKEVSLQKIDPDLEKAVDVDGDGIILAMEQSIEVR